MSRHLLERQHRVEDVGVALRAPLPAMPASLLGRHAELKTGDAELKTGEPERQARIVLAGSQ